MKKVIVTISQTGTAAKQKRKPKRKVKRTTKAKKQTIRF